MPFKLCERTKFANGRGKFWIASGERERKRAAAERECESSWRIITAKKKSQ